jgi:hypothetical protein
MSEIRIAVCLILGPVFVLWLVNHLSLGGENRIVLPVRFIGASCSKEESDSQNGVSTETGAIQKKPVSHILATFAENKKKRESGIDPDSL